MPSGDDIDREEQASRHRDAGVGAKLEDRLGQLDLRLLALRRSSWENMRKGDPGSVRLAAAGQRELYTEILHLLAPDEAVMITDIWLKRSPSESVNRPTRRMRIQFIGDDAESQLNASVQFIDSMERANEYTHTFAENAEVVRVYLSQVENCVYLLLASAKANAGHR
jgi:hypothetical protein